MRVDHTDPQATALIADALLHLLPAGRPVVLCCVGSDRSTGDALGPLVGSRLSRRLPAGSVWGTIDSPAHGGNLPAVLEEVHLRAPGAFVVGVDACLGPLANVGCVRVLPEPLYPGAGIGKGLPPVGQAYITGTVNVGGFLEYLVLQNTRLSLVMAMARVIADGILAAVAGSADLCEAAAAVDRP